MLWAYKSIAFGGWKHCFWKLGALLLEAESIAFGSWEQCFWKLGAMLLAPFPTLLQTFENCAGVGWRLFFDCELLQTIFLASSVF